ncbi:MAG: type VI secretion system-associated protein TagF [Planctomycetes bacterium]|nr:type VI secretion system-associated protein TagF [Planctomycetota bacterium]
MALFGASRAAPSRIGCFGKLPVYGDFLSSGADSPEAEAFVTWLQEGAAASVVPSFAPDQVLQMLWQPVGARRTLAALLWPSQDAAGRRFPFAIFTSLAGGFVDRHGPRALVAADGVWRAMRELRTAVAAAPRQAEVYACFRDANAPTPPEDRAVNRAYVDRAQAAQFRREDFVPVGLHVQDLIWFAENLGGTADPRFALRMPLHGSADPLAEGATWLHVLHDRLGLGTLDAALVVRSARADGSSVFEFRRPLARDDFSFLFAPTADYRAADHLGFRVAPTSAADASFLERFQRAWGARPPSCATVLETGAQGWTPGEMATGPVVLGNSDPVTIVGIAAPLPGPQTDGSDRAAPGRDAPVRDVPGRDVPVRDVPTGRVYEAEPITDPQPMMLLPTDGILPVTQPATQPVAESEPGTADVVTGEVVPTPRVLADRVRELVRRPMMPGRVVRIDAGGPTPVVLLADGSNVSHVRSPAPEAVEELERRTRDHDEAVRLIAELERIHREMEADLRRMVDDACSRTTKPAQEERRA